jgi:hypothetical protein
MSDATKSKASQLLLDRIEGQRNQEIEVVIDDFESARHNTGRLLRISDNDSDGLIYGLPD